MKGDLLAALAANGGGDATDAEGWCRRALERSRTLGARMSQLRAATRLGRPSRDRAEAEADVSVLAAVRATFTEGFATAGLTEAREVLAAAGRFSPD